MLGEIREPQNAEKQTRRADLQSANGALCHAEGPDPGRVTGCVQNVFKELVASQELEALPKSRAATDLCRTTRDRCRESCYNAFRCCMRVTEID